jgi:hypothetical protein
MEWTVVLAGPARKSLKRIPAATGNESSLRWERCNKIRFKATSASYKGCPASVGA